MYKIIYRNTFYGDEEIDTAETRKEAEYLLAEYRLAFNGSGIVYMHPEDVE